LKALAGRELVGIDLALSVVVWRDVSKLLSVIFITVKSCKVGWLLVCDCLGFGALGRGDRHK